MLRGVGAFVAAGVVVLVALAGPPALGALGGLGRPAFHEPQQGTAVYDPAGALSARVERALEQQIDRLEDRAAAEVVVYVRVDATATEDGNLADAAALIDQWGIGRAGYDDGFVILLSFEDSRFEHGVLSTYAGSGFRAAYLNDEEQAQLRDEVIIP
ncbi:MAG TPA: TPM domain-containing protein, partial [Candidatus Limnocylindria bacterium]|nr:TPM domain-containing protein [Candidatus Limnocylindria bacterium]